MENALRAARVWFPADSRVELGYELEPLPPIANAFSYSHDIGLWMALCSGVAYLNQADGRRMLHAAGFEDVRFIPPTGADAWVAVHRAAGHAFAVLAFRGTDSLEDLLTDFKFRRRAVAGHAGGRAHRGFQDALDEIWDDVAAALREIRKKHGALPLYLTGHSLGGAQSLLAAISLAATEDLDPPAAVVNIGCPRVGNARMREAIAAVAPVHRVIHASDTVPRVPPLLFGYRHAGSEHWLLPDGRERTFPHRPSLADRTRWLNLAYGQSYAFRQYLGVSLMLALLLTAALYRGLDIEAALGVGGALLLAAVLWGTMLGAMLFVADLLPRRMQRWFRPHAVIDHRCAPYVEDLARRTGKLLVPRPPAAA